MENEIDEGIHSGEGCISLIKTAEKFKYLLERQTFA